jgi:lysophospholipase L1-like esterase
MTAMKSTGVENPDIRINPQGFRSAIDLDQPKTKPRCFILGGSFAFGAGASGAHTYYAAVLTNRFRNIHFINAAGSSFTANQQFIQLALNVMPYEPDYVIVIDGFNDMALPMVFGQPAGAPWRWTEYKDFLSGSFWRMAAAYIRVHSQFYRVGSRLRLSRRAEADTFGQSTLQRVIEEYLHATEMTYTLCRARGIKVYHVFQPQLAIDKPVSEAEQGLSLPSFNKAMQKNYPVLEQEAEALALTNNVPFLSLLPVFKNNTNTLYVDYCHVNDVGQEIVGTRIVDFLKANGFPGEEQ